MGNVKIARSRKQYEGLEQEYLRGFNGALNLIYFGRRLEFVILLQQRLSLWERRRLLERMVEILLE